MLGILAGICTIAAAAGVTAVVLGGEGGPRIVASALASADTGEYVIAIAGGEREDAVLAFAADDPATIREVARFSHLPGYTSRGATSPAGRRAALIVADGGTQSRPIASLILLDLDTGALTRFAERVDTLQTPLFDPSGSRVIFTRTAASDSPATNVQVSEIDIATGWESPIASVPGVLGAYPVGFDASGALLIVVIDGRGSSLLRAGETLLQLSDAITRDWRVSPDGQRIAFVETLTTNGVSYHARVIDLVSAAGGRVAAQQVASGEQLGIAWRPGSADPTAGQDPSSTGGGALHAAGAEAGFDVPLGYSGSGDYLVAETWSGASFDAPGQVEMQLLHGGARHDLHGATRFLGWVTR